VFCFIFIEKVLETFSIIRTVSHPKNNNLYHIVCFQIDYPHSTGGGQFPVSVNPDLIDPNDYHEDRPSFSSGTNKQAVKEYYPVILTKNIIR
jgi:hypothetical protein